MQNMYSIIINTYTFKHKHIDCHRFDTIQDTTCIIVVELQTLEDSTTGLQE